MLKQAPTAYDLNINMPKRTLNPVDPTKQLCFVESNAFHLNKLTWFAVSSVYDLNIDMPKRTLNLVDPTKQLCFVELNTFHLNKQTWFAVSSTYDP